MRIDAIEKELGIIKKEKRNRYEHHTEVFVLRLTKEEYIALKAISKKTGIEMAKIIRHFLKPYLVMLIEYAKWKGWFFELERELEGL
ncbi:MAG: ribbon-helix-helix domain-containing protein [Desulfurococcaceae archaeon]